MNPAAEVGHQNWDWSEPNAIHYDGKQKSLGHFKYYYFMIYVANQMLEYVICCVSKVLMKLSVTVRVSWCAWIIQELRKQW